MNYVVHADCLGPSGLPSLSDKCIDVLIQDPPYDENTHNKQRRGQTPDYTEPTRPNATTAQFNRVRDLGFDFITPDQMAQSARACARLVKRWILTFCAMEMISDWKRCFEAAGLQYVRTCVWLRKGAPQFSGDRPAHCAEAIVCAHPEGRKRWNGRGKHGLYPFDFDVDDGLTVAFEEPIVLNRGREKVRLHTAQKPLKLMERLIELFSDPDELVCDPYTGAGTTGVAALIHGRRFLGVECDGKYVQIANDRIAREVPCQKSTTPTTAAPPGSTADSKCEAVPSPPIEAR